MQKLKIALVAGAFTLASTMAFAQASLSTKSGTAVDTGNPSATVNSNTGVKAGNTDATVNAKTKMNQDKATTGADVNAGTRPSSSINGNVNGAVNGTVK